MRIVFLMITVFFSEAILAGATSPLVRVERLRAYGGNGLTVILEERVFSELEQTCDGQNTFKTGDDNYSMVSLLLMAHANNREIVVELPGSFPENTCPGYRQQIQSVTVY